MRMRGTRSEAGEKAVREAAAAVGGLLAILLFTMIAARIAAYLP
ncbi:MAG: hypothetical protein QXW88_05135 [Thermofilum sp.]